MEETKKKKWEKIIYWGLFIILLPDLVYLLLIGVEEFFVSWFSKFNFCIPIANLQLLLHKYEDSSIYSYMLRSLPSPPLNSLITNIPM